MQITNIKAVRGDTFSRSLTITQNDEPVDITDWTIYLTLKSDIDDSDGDAVYTQDVTSHTVAASGQTVVSIPKTTTINLTGDYQYGIKAKKSDDTTLTLLAGTVTFDRTATREV